MFGIKREKLNKQVTFREAREIMKRKFEDTPAMRDLYRDAITKILYEERVFFQESKLHCEGRAEHILNKIFFEDR